MYQYRSERGFTYLVLLFAVAILGAMAAFTGMLWSTSQQRTKERQLIFIGDEFRRAIGEYYKNSPGAVKRYPANLQVLLLDLRHVTTKRYLRRVYTDPMSFDQDWALMLGPDGTVIGVHSKSKLRPIKRDFSGRDVAFATAETYADWKFVYLPQVAAESPQ